MKQFILYASKAVTSPDFSLNDLPGSGGRMDLVARCIGNALWLSHDLRRDTYIHVVACGSPPVVITFYGNLLRGCIARWKRHSGMDKENVGINAAESRDNNTQTQFSTVSCGVGVRGEQLLYFRRERHRSSACKPKRGFGIRPRRPHRTADRRREVRWTVWTRKDIAWRYFLSRIAVHHYGTLWIG